LERCPRASSALHRGGHPQKYDSPGYYGVGINELSIIKPHLKAVFAINRKIVNTAIGRDVIEALADYKFPVLKTAIS
jgi:hypothetical protein